MGRQSGLGYRVTDPVRRCDGVVGCDRPDFVDKAQRA